MRLLLLALLLVSSGCTLPQVAHRPVVRNPFPQLTRVAVAPFFNLSAEPAINGRQVALALLPETLPQAWDELMYQPAYLQARDLLP